MAGYKEKAKEMSSGDVFSVLHKMAEENCFRWEPLKWGFEYVYCQERLYLIRDKERAEPCIWNMEAARGMRWTKSAICLKT